MLDNLYFVEDIKKRYHLNSDDTARRRMRQMGGTGRPLYVTEDMIKAWDRRPNVTKCENRIPKRDGR